MHFSRSHTLGVEEARQRVDRMADSLATRLGLTSRWQGDDLVFEGSGARGVISVSDVAVDIDVQLGLALMMMQSSIRDAIEDAMDRNLG